ncbi:hypothetical protein [Mucilaginibacter aquaedulcis]|uniref:hypothetical protein n=1 Tax=Mucilaginibacter aquaedulcis TaxID=1187081 RepID=UPI0025B487A8|nr:hypothetical protein [Mucilaginibacter aquaedulcis]MDN3551484.1 hypothetical protein [Mucilaginibacter aquaedulcis]
MSNYETIKSAIENKHQIHAIYQGHLRLMCPHCLGTKAGVQQALFYQFGGSSSKGAIIPDSPQNWRCIPIDTLEIVDVVSDTWHTCGNHSTPSKCIDDKHIEVCY